MRRRDFNRLTLAGTAIGATGIWLGPSWGQQLPSAQTVSNSQDLNWQCRIVRFEPEPELECPPVITQICAQPNGQLLAIVGDDHLVRICHKDTGAIVAKLEGHGDWVRCAEFSHDGSKLISAGNDRQILEWNLLNGNLARVIDQQDHAIATVKMDPRGRILAVAGFQPSVSIYNVDTGRIQSELEGPCGDIRSLAFSPTGEWLAAGGRSGVIRIWEVASGRRLRDIAIHQRRIRQLQFISDPLAILSCAEDRLVKVTPFDGGESASLPRRPAKIHSVEMLGSEIIASGGSDNLIRIWSRISMSEIGQLVGHRGTVATLAFDGSTLYSGGFDTELRIWTLSAETAAAARRTTDEVGRSLNQFQIR